MSPVKTAGRTSALRMVRSFLSVGSATAFMVGSSFARGVILARILGPSEYGLALILITITAALDLFADAGIDRFIVQNRFGRRADVMATSHAFRVGGSAVVGLAIVALAYPLSLGLRATEIWLAIALTGGVVMIRSFANLSYKLQQREHRFGKETIITVAMFAADLATTTLAALWLKSAWAVILGAYANSLVYLALTHILADQPYSFLPRRRLVGLVKRFSLPIYINAAMLLASSQGDRIVVAILFAKRDLAFYAAACAIGQGLVGLAARVTMNILLPWLSPRTGAFEVRRRRTNILGAAMLAISTGFLAALSVVAPYLVPIIYGQEFGGLGELIFASAVVQMIQLEQNWLTTLLIANGLTSRFPIITMMRAAAFPAAFLFVMLGFSLLSIPLAFAVGAALSLAMSYSAAWSLKLIDPRLTAASFARIALAIGAVGLLARS